MRDITGRKKYFCKYPGCNNWYYTHISGDCVNNYFFTFPKDRQSLELWRCVCEKRLNADAVPISLENECYPLMEHLPVSNESNHTKVSTCNQPSTPSAFCPLHVSHLQENNEKIVDFAFGDLTLDDDNCCTVTTDSRGLFVFVGYNYFVVGANIIFVR